MKRMIQYTVRAGRIAENERLIEAVFDELGRTRPAGLHYASLRVGDTGTFVHLVDYDGPDDGHPLPRLPAFRAFTAGLRERCEVPPATIELREVGTYGAAPATAEHA